ncbi:MAG: hypothetical protein WCJ71_10480 [Candidatus Omnitrophota bacterium]
MGAVLACQEIFCIILRRKPVAGDAIGGGLRIGGRPIEKSSQLLVKSPGKMLFFKYNQEKPPRHAFFNEALCMDIGIPEVIGVAEDRLIAEDRGRRILEDTVRQAHGSSPLGM